MSKIETGVERALVPFANFVDHQASNSIVLLICTITALGLANSPWAAQYFAALATELGVRLGEQELALSIRLWVSDGLMAVFFYLLGSELKREFLAGQFADWRQALPVVVAAAGGMLVPASLYLLFTFEYAELRSGWGIPLATDAAFAIGLLALLGSRIPTAVITLVTALAIIDDLGAIIVIAVFYTETLDVQYLLYAAGLVGLLVLANLGGARTPWVYFPVGVLLWYCIHHSGVHATIAGVLVAACVPARAKKDPDWLLRRLPRLLRVFERKTTSDEAATLADEAPQEVADEVVASVRQATTPLRRWEHKLENVVFLIIMPLFALANAGIAVQARDLLALIDNPMSLGIAAGLLVGKVTGIAGSFWLLLRAGVARLPEGTHFAHVVGVGLLSGVGFTMSIFIAGLTFDTGSEVHTDALASVLVTSLLAAIAGLAWLRFACPEPAT